MSCVHCLCWPWLRSFREICHALQSSIEAKFPSSEEDVSEDGMERHKTRHTVVAGFLVLRFLCPAIIDPGKYGMWDGLYPYEAAVLHLFCFEHRAPLPLD